MKVNGLLQILKNLFLRAKALPKFNRKKLLEQTSHFPENNYPKQYNLPLSYTRQSPCPLT